MKRDTRLWFPLAFLAAGSLLIVVVGPSLVRPWPRLSQSLALPSPLTQPPPDGGIWRASSLGPDHATMARQMAGRVPGIE